MLCMCNYHIRKYASMLIILLVIVIMVCYVCSCIYDKHESFDANVVANTNSKSSADVKVPFFSDVITYENEYDASGNLVKTGLDKCKSEAQLSKSEATCVEYGIGGTAFYYPNYYPLTASEAYSESEMV